MGKSWQIERRSFLRGACGAAMALPLLDVMAPDADAAKAGPPCRIAAVVTPIGKNMNTWTPKTEGAGFELPATLESLADLRQDFSILSGLCNPRAWGGHLVEGASFLTGADILSGTPGYNWKNTISMDQLAAEHVGHLTRLPSLELLKKGSGTKQHSLSWSREGVAQSGESDPTAVFDRLFLEGSAEDKKQLASLYSKKKSILDLVREDYKRLEGRVGKRDKQLLDQYATAVREVERRVKLAEEWSKKPKPKINGKRPKPVRDGGVKQRGPHMRAMMDLMVLAMQTDSTRIMTYSLCDSGAVIPESGIKEAHHGLSHHGNNVEKLKKLTKIDQFHVKQLAYFLKKLKDTPDGGGNLLKHSMVVYGSGLGDGSRHSLKDLPILLAGHGCGKLKQGFHHKYESNMTPLSNLWLVMLQKIGLEIESFSDSTGTLDHVA